MDHVRTAYKAIMPLLPEDQVEAECGMYRSLADGSDYDVRALLAEEEPCNDQVLRSSICCARRCDRVKYDASADVLR